MTIGKLAARTGVGVETIRYYERHDFLSAPDRLPPAAGAMAARQ
ncbi:MerR family DNA-binding transcriptional regulator [Kordiimonas aquimaris]